jgi:hypothetical protein
MKLPIRLVPNGLGELADLKDGDDRYVAHCVEEADARELLGFANGRGPLLAAAAEERARLEADLDAERRVSAALRRHLREYEQTTPWHEKRRRLMGEPAPVDERGGGT